MRAGVDPLKTSPARQCRARGRIEQSLLDEGRGLHPNRPKTFARNPTLPQEVTNVSTHDKAPEAESPGLKEDGTGRVHGILPDPEGVVTLGRKFSGSWNATACESSQQILATDATSVSTIVDRNPA